jgi:hypothetical protein
MTTKAKPSDAVAHKYPQDVDTVFKLMTTEQYLMDRAYWVKEVDPEAKVEWNGELPKITLQRWVLRDYPKFLKKLFPAKQGMGDVENWQKDGSNWKGSYVIDVQGNPVEVTGDFTLRATPGGGSEFSIRHGVTAKIPLLGGKIEKYILKETQMGCGDELVFCEKRLAGDADLIPRDVGKYPIPKK